MDQGLYTGTNFALALLLTMKSGVAEMGDYALVSSVAVLFHSVFSGAVTEPMTVFGASPSLERVRASYGRVALATCGSLMLLAWIGYVLAGRGGLPYFAGASMGVALFAAQALILCQKRYLYLADRPLQAVLASGLYAAMGAAVALLFVRSGHFAVPDMVLAIVIAGVVASLQWTIRLARTQVPVGIAIMNAWRNRRFTFWLVASGVPAALATQAIYWIADLRSSREVVGQLKLFEQLAAPGQQVVSAVTIADQVSSSVAIANGDRHAVAMQARRSALLYSGIACAYVPLAMLAVALLGKYKPELGLLSVVVVAIYMCALIAQSWSAAWNVAARVVRAPEIIAYGYCAMGVLVVALALVAGARSTGDFAAVLLAAWGGQAATIWYLSRRKLLGG